MQTKISAKKIRRELKHISENIPAELLASLVKKEKVAPTVQALIEKALLIPDGEHDMTPEKRLRFQHLLKSGLLSRQVEVLDKDAESAISAYYDAEIALAVKLGRLPKDAPMPDFIRKKGIKYARKQKERLEELFSGKEDSEQGEGRDSTEHS